MSLPKLIITEKIKELCHLIGGETIEHKPAVNQSIQSRAIPKKPKKPQILTEIKITKKEIMYENIDEGESSKTWATVRKRPSNESADQNKSIKKPKKLPF